MADITGVVITLNEESNITECLKSLAQVCSHFVVVDSGSTDRTRELAEQQGAKVIVQPYLGDGKQKNVAIRASSTDWVLSLDADERLTSEAVEAIKGLELSGSGPDSYAFRRRNYIGSRWVKYGGWYPDYCTRLMNKSKCMFSDSEGHAAVQGTSTQKLKADLIHYSYKDLGELFEKANRFSWRGAKALYRRGKKAGPLAPATHGLSAFVRRYLFRGGFLGGSDGLAISVSAAVNSYMKYAKLRELQSDKSVRERLGVETIW